MYNITNSVVNTSYYIFLLYFDIVRSETFIRQLWNILNMRVRLGFIKSPRLVYIVNIIKYKGSFSLELIIQTSITNINNSTKRYNRLPNERSLHSKVPNSVFYSFDRVSWTILPARCVCWLISFGPWTPRQWFATQFVCPWNFLPKPSTRRFIV